MKLQVLDQLRQPVGSTSSYEIDEPSVRFPGLNVARLAGTVTLLRTDRGLLARVSAKAEVGEECSRCLAETSCSVAIDFDEEYVPFLDPVTGRTIADDSHAEPIARIGSDFVLDLGDGFRQYILMGEPLRPLCKPDCAGLCQTCGADLNARKCRCSEDTPTPDN